MYSFITPAHVFIQLLQHPLSSLYPLSSPPLSSSPPFTSLPFPSFSIPLFSFPEFRLRVLGCVIISPMRLERSPQTKFNFMHYGDKISAFRDNNSIKIRQKVIDQICWVQDVRGTNDV